jgi:phosphate:Na+ symporter
VDQDCAPIGQNIGMATGSAMAAIGRRTTDKRLTVAYILFKVIAALIALVSFPAVIRLLIRAESTIDGATLLAAYHTAYNIVVVLVLMPVIGLFTRFVERLLPDRTSPLTRCSNPAALTVPIAAVEGVRRTVARTVGSICGSVDAA